LARNRRSPKRPSEPRPSGVHPEEAGVEQLAERLDQKLDVIDQETLLAYEFKVSGKNAWAEFYKDIVKVLMWNQRRKTKLRGLVFITEEKFGRPFLDAPMPRAYVKYLAEQGLEVTITYVRHDPWVVRAIGNNALEPS
jgi:hypothetical protein